MRCSAYSSDGPLMSEGACELSDDGITMAAESWHMTPQPEGPPLALLLEDGQRYQVRVAEVHVTEADAAAGPREVYHLIPLDSDEHRESGGMLARLRSLFGRTTDERPGTST